MSDASEATPDRVRDPRRAESVRRLSLAANCYFHPHTIASALCEICGRTLCVDSIVRMGAAVRCEECVRQPAASVWICGRCGRLAREMAGPCGRCGTELRPRRWPSPADMAFWEHRFRGYLRDDRLWVFGVTWLATYGIALLGGMPLGLLGVPQSPGWWVFVAAVSCACGAAAARMAERAARYELLLSQDGIEFHTRRRGWERLRWDEVLGLELTPDPTPALLVVHGPGRQIVISADLPGWKEAVRLIRQHAIVAPPPALAW